MATISNVWIELKLAVEVPELPLPIALKIHHVLVHVGIKIHAVFLWFRRCVLLPEGIGDRITVIHVFEILTFKRFEAPIIPIKPLRVAIWPEQIIIEVRVRVEALLFWFRG